ncbi:MAG: hypothetical protein HXX09_13745 [Bacteroidetes bacterium]|nr:hypothetical protein [Bacteroidota bacterium]
MDYEKAKVAFKSINESKLTDLKYQLFKAAIRYANIRAEWIFLDLEQRKDQDPERTAAHNRFIDSCNIIARNMKNTNEDISWAEILKQDRKDIGDFACFITAIIGIQNR